jgi:hypothetical protein
MTLVDTVVGIGLLLVIFLALFGILRASAMVSSLAKAKTGAAALAQSQMEYLRGLGYDDLGTSGGIPSGSIPQNATTTLNGIGYGVRTFIDYVDDPADGLGANDTNHITADYKRAKVTVSYFLGGTTRTVSLVSEFAPPGIESSNGGGTLTINVVDATGAPLPGATVQISNAGASPAVSVNTVSDSTGSASFPGAPVATGYQITVSRDGYSTAQTYARTADNQNPNPGYLTVVKNQTTTSTFAIDRLATLAIATFSPIATSTFADAFADSSKVAALSSTTVSGGAIALAGGGGSYETTGSARSVATTSPYLASWGDAYATTTQPAGTSALIHIYDGSGALVPDSALAGNAAGFSSFPVRLEGISTTTYPSLAIGATLSGDGSSTPLVQEWSLSYAAGPTPLPGVPFSLTGAKTIGTTGAGAPIYKTTVATSTGSDGTRALSLEWDSYALSLSGYDIEDECGEPPYAIPAGSSVSASLILGAQTANALMVAVSDASGTPVTGATVTLSKTGYSAARASSDCGNAYFGSLASGSYALQIAKSGYTTTSFTGIPVSGMTTYDASFN